MSEQPKRVLLVGSFWEASIEKFYRVAFASIGAEVGTFELAPSRHSENLLNTLKLKLGAHPDLVENLIEAARSFNPDLVIIFKGKYLSPLAIKNLRTMLPRAVLTNFNPDSPWERSNTSRFLRAAIPAYDIHFTWSRRLLAEFLGHNAKRVDYLPFAYDPELHQPTEHTFDNFVPEYDLAFVGSHDTAREKLLCSLTHLNLIVCGNGWAQTRLADRNRVTVLPTALYGWPAMSIFDQALCGLNLLREQNANSHNMRTFELPASGHVMLTERTEEQSEFFEEGKEMLCFGSMDELRAKVEWLRVNPELRRLMALNARAAARPHTYAARAKYILTQVFNARHAQW